MGGEGAGLKLGGGVMGHSVGPRWADALAGSQATLRKRAAGEMSGGPAHRDATTAQRPAGDVVAMAPRGRVSDRLVLEPETEVSEIREGSEGGYRYTVVLSNGATHGVDAVVCCVGVDPNTDWLPAEVERAEDGGVLVRGDMRSVSAEDVYAAGDSCTVQEGAFGPQWFQMRLWTQARTMGAFAGE